MKRFNIYFFLFMLGGLHQACFKDKLVEPSAIIPNDTYHANDNRLDLLSQKALDDFGAAGYRAVKGDFVIENVFDLSPLSKLEEVSGSLIIRDCPDLTYLKGLNNLKEVGGLLIFNCGIVNIDGLENLRNVLNGISIQHAHRMVHLRGLERIESLGTGFGISSCNALQSVDLLPTMKSIRGISFSRCPNLTTITGFNEIQEIRGSLVFIENDRLSQIDLFPKLESIRDHFQIRECPNLISVKGFESLSSIGYLELLDCDTLSDINIFSNVNQLNRFQFEGLRNLKSISAFSQLTAINESLVMEECSLADLDFLSSLEKLAHSGRNPALRIKDNPDLSDFCGLRNVDFGSSINFYINRNAYNPTMGEIQSDACK